MTFAESLSSTLGEMAFAHPLRRYQGLALEAFERRRTSGHRTAYLVMPPGAGKTLLGLEISRRLGQRTLVLTPNTAVQSQWLKQWQAFAPPHVGASPEPSLASPITVLTYQSLCSLRTDHAELEEQALDLWQQALSDSDGLTSEAADRAIERLREAQPRRHAEQLARYRRRARNLLARGGSRDELLGILHRNGRAIVERAAESGPFTVVLDECHHLLQMWGYLVRAVLDELGPETWVIGLTATPPDLLTGREVELYQSLFADADFSVPTPALVRQGDLAPYQELALLVRPLEHEEDYIADQHGRFQRLVSRLLDADFASRSFVEWLRQRVVDRKTPTGAVISWAAFERDEPALSQAALRFLHHYELALPRDVRLREAHRQAMVAEDWIALIEGFSLDVLKLSGDQRDAAAWEEIRTAVRTLGYVLTVQGIRSHAAPVDRVLALSGSKAVATTEILRVEHGVLGEHLRALVMCDYERAGAEVLASLRGVLDPQAGSAWFLLETLASDATASELHPVLLTARTVACARATLPRLWSWLVEREPRLADASPSVLDSSLPSMLGSASFTSSSPLAPSSSTERASRPPARSHWTDLVVLNPDTPLWRPRLYVPLLTRAFEDGIIQCLVGTRGLLGEGWDAQRVNVLVDLTAAGTAVAVHQMRGRSLRLDPRLPRKVADNWDVVCVDPVHPKGAGDYARFVRKHDRYYAPTADGEVESGVSHVHPALSAYGPPAPESFNQVNESMYARARDRHAAYDRWHVGTPYENTEIQTVRLQFRRAPGLPGTRLLRRSDGFGSGLGVRARVASAAGLAALSGAAGFVVATPLLVDPVLAISLGLVAGSTFGGAWLIHSLRDPVGRLKPSDTLHDLASAIVAALRATDGIARSLGPEHLRIALQEDGFYRCYLAGATRAESALFAESLDELCAPLASPRYLIPRRLAPAAPSGALDTLRFAWQATVDRRVAYHAVPAYLAANKSRVAAFEHAWHRFVSPGRALFVQDPRAQVILELQHSVSPFDATSQLRLIWH